MGGKIPKFANLTNINVDNANTEPTERSNSPDIIKNDMPNATIPNSAAKVNIAVIELIVKNLFELREKNTIVKKRPVKAPNSGFFINILNTNEYKLFLYNFLFSFLALIIIDILMYY